MLFRSNEFFSNNYADWGKYEPVGEEIVEEAKGEGLDLALACAMIEKESAGRNIFGCDGGTGVGDQPPYCWQTVTKRRVQALIQSPHMNGVGLTQITWWEFVDQAEKEGGAHLPRYQCRIGFRVLKDLVDKYDYLEALGGYNAGEYNRWLGVQNGYAGDVAAKQAAWRLRLKDETDPPPEPVEWPTRIIAVGESRWLFDEESKAWIKAPMLPDGTQLIVEGGNWIRVVEGDTPLPPPPPEDWKWPVANNPVGWLGDGSYADLYPTRYTFRADVEGIARRIVNKFGVSANTYLDHPPRYGRDYDSVDYWGPPSRGYELDYATGQQIFSEVFYDPNPPHIDWIIWQGWLYAAWNGWQGTWWGDHFDHIHVTYLK